jgi:hypothetical protein
MQNPRKHLIRSGNGDTEQRAAKKSTVKSNVDIYYNEVYLERKGYSGER